MRTIKFRAWDKERIRMLTGNNGLYMYLCCGVIGWNFGYDYNDIGSYDKQDRFILMQFTGLLDKNGKEIYEGDIIDLFQFYRPHNFKRYQSIIFINGAFIAEKSSFGWEGENLIDPTACSVIGNIYENPELL